MEDDVIATHFENLDRRFAKVERILPTLATKQGLTAAIALLATKEELREAIAPLATKKELREAIALLATKEELREAIAPLATKEELREAIAVAVAPLATQEGLDELRRHMNILHEDLRSDIRLLAEHVASDRPKHGRT